MLTPGADKLIQRKIKGSKTGETEWIAPDERDLLELTNRQNAKAVRNCILQVLPKDYILDAMDTAKETLLREAFNSVLSPQLITDTEGNVVLANRAFRGWIDLGNQRADEALASRFSASPAVTAEFRQLKETIRKGQPSIAELPVIRGGKVVEWRRIVARPIDGVDHFFHWRFEDISERRRMERAMRDEQNKLIDFMAHAPVGIYSVDQHGRFRFVNKTLAVLEGRLAPANSTVDFDLRVPHDAREVAQAIKAAIADGAELVVVYGASAITDRRDVIPAAIEIAGGRIEHFGMPVDPGNLMLVGEVEGRTVLGAPGCARSPKENGFDWVLQRIMAGIQVKRADLTGLGVGGLLMEIIQRGHPRDPHAGPND
jgi:PAS domain-containing protein